MTPELISAALGAGLLVLQHVARARGWRLPDLLHPSPPPAAPAQPKPDAPAPAPDAPAPKDDPLHALAAELVAEVFKAVKGELLARIRGGARP